VPATGGAASACDADQDRPPPENEAVEPGSGTGSVVWWRQSPPTPTIRIHQIGWVDVTGRPTGHLEIRSPHLRLDERTIHTALAEHLVPASYPTMPIIRPAHRVPETELSLETGLIIDGHTITHRDLLIPYGIDVVAGISAQLLVRGPKATIVLEETLQQPVKDAVLTTIRRSLHQFAAATPTELFDAGWQRRRDDRWQLILTQARPRPASDAS